MTKDKRSFFLFTQARLGSQRIPQKMLKPFGDTTLWDIACKKLNEIDLPITQKWVSLYEKELLDVAAKYKISKYIRSRESAECDGPVKKVWEICSHISFKYYVMFNPCSPFLKVETINKFVNHFVNSEHKSLFAVVPIRDYFWDEGGELCYPKDFDLSILNTKACPQMYKAAHVLYAGLTEDMRNNIQLGNFSKNYPELFVMRDGIELLDIDYQWQFDLAEALYKK